MESLQKFPNRGRGTRTVRAVEAAALFAAAAGFGFLALRQAEIDAALRNQADAIRASEAFAAEKLAAFGRDAMTTADRAGRDAIDAARATDASVAVLRADLAKNDERLAVQSRLLDEIECRHESSLGRTRDELDERLRALAGRIDADREAQISTADRFRSVQRRSDSGVFLVHCAFTYAVLEDDVWVDREATAWGTAFLATADGLLVTNKHLVQPWKFDPELAAMRAMGDARIDEDAVRISAWPAGEVCLDKDRKPLFENGFNTTRGDLALVLTAEDRYVTRTLETMRRDVAYDVHALDDRDLALLRISGGPFVPLRLAGADEERSLKKLDPVMTLGFPRGNSGLEGGVAESSATVGVVRKIENSIQVTAPIIAGNSGGPLIDERGLVVGVATRIYSETLGICIKVGRVRELIERAETARNASPSALVASPK